MAKKVTPQILHVWPSIRNKNAPLQEFKVAIIKFHNNPDYQVDIREFVTSPQFQGYTSKGITFNLDQLIQLVECIHGGGVNGKGIYELLESYSTSNLEKSQNETPSSRTDEKVTESSSDN